MKHGPSYHKHKTESIKELCGIQMIEIWQDELCDERYKKIIDKAIKYKLKA